MNSGLTGSPTAAPRAGGSLERFLRTLRAEGAMAAAELALRRAASQVFGQDRTYFTLAAWTDRFYDWRNGVDTGGVIQLADLKLDAHAGRNYIGMAPRTWRLIIRRLPGNPKRFTYIDLGCGKGRTLLLASEAGFGRVIGIDLSADLLKVAGENAVKKNARVELVECNATLYEFPDTPTVLFMFNPFYGDVMQQVAERFAASVRRHPREVYVLYFRPAVEGVWERYFDVFHTNDAAYPWYTIYSLPR